MKTFQYFFKLILPVLAIVLFGCEEKIDWDYPPSDDTRISVTAILTDEHKIQEIEIFQSVASPNEVPIGISNAQVVLSTIDNSITFLSSDDRPGVYLSPAAFSTPSDRTIHLEIILEGQSYEADARMGSVIPIPPIQISIIEDSQRRFISKIADVFSPAEQAMYEVQIDWSAIEPDTINSALLYAYTFNTVDISGLLQPSEESINFPIGTTIVEKKFGLTAEYAAFLRALSIETNWQSGIFDESQSSLPTNISNNALGFFAVCQTLSDTIIVQ